MGGRIIISKHHPAVHYPANNPGGTCIPGTFSIANDVKLSPPGAAGGGCTSTLSKHKEAFTFAKR